jgi:hypothetical protein
LTCACGNFGTVTDTGRSQAIRQANRRGWKISEGTKRCWCPECEPPKGEGPRRRGRC